MLKYLHSNLHHCKFVHQFIKDVAATLQFGVIKMNTQYISFCGTFNVPENVDALAAQFPISYYEIYEGTDSHGEERYREVSTGFRSGLSYEAIDGKDSLTVYLAKVSGNIGHLVASCPAGGWADETFVFVDEHGRPVKSAENFNPNPVEQLCEG